MNQSGFDDELPKNERRLLNAKELAGMLNMSERSLWRNLSAGKIPEPVRIGGSTRWRHEEIDRWIANGCPPRDGKLK